MINLVDLKKRSNFFESPPPRENPRSAPTFFQTNFCPTPFQVMHTRPEYLISSTRGGFRGGGVLTPPPHSGIRPLTDPKGPPFDTFSEIHFWQTNPKIFLKAPLAPVYTNFEGERAPKKRDFFLSKFFKKCPKTAFLTVFSKNCLRRSKILPK